MKAHMGAQMNRKFKGKVPDPMDISQEPYCVEIWRKNAGRRFRGQRFMRACAVETHMDIAQEDTRAILLGSLQEKCRTHLPGHMFCASLRSGHAHGHFTRANFVGKLAGKMPHTHLNTSIEHRTLSLTVRTPQCDHSVWGKHEKG